MRSLFFNICFYGGTAIFALFCVVLSFLPGRKPLMWGLSRYTKAMVWCMRVVAGIDVQVTGRDKIPAGPAIIAAKHQSYGDGVVMFSQFFDLSFVTGDHLEKFMILKQILRKAGAVVVDSCGGSDMHKRMARETERVKKEGRRILIYPEGHLSAVGSHHRYRKGVYHIYKEFGCPVVPVATNLGQRWDQQSWQKHPGEAHVEFLDPIAPGLEKDEFMALLQERIETRSLELLDYDNPGALNPENVGKLLENHVAKAKREQREAGQTTAKSSQS